MSSKSGKLTNSSANGRNSPFLYSKDKTLTMLKTILKQFQAEKSFKTCCIQVKTSLKTQIHVAECHVGAFRLIFLEKKIQNCQNLRT